MTMSVASFALSFASSFAFVLLLSFVACYLLGVEGAVLGIHMFSDLSYVAKVALFAK